MNTNSFNKEWSELAATIERLHTRHVPYDAIHRQHPQGTEQQLLRTLYENMEGLVDSIRAITKPDDSR